MTQTRPPRAPHGHYAGERLRDRLGDMAPQVRRAAVYALAHADVVPFMTVRQLASASGVAPASVVRLARAGGFAGYVEMRDAFADALRHRATAPGGRQPPAAPDPRQLTAAIEAVADAIVAARTVYVVGFRSAYAFAHYLVYMGRMALPRFRLADPSISSVEDHLALAEASDLVILYSVAPYSSEAVELIDRLGKAGVPTVAVTDGATSPMARRARHVLEVERTDLGTIRSMAGCLLASELLLEACFARLGAAADDSIAQFERGVRRLAGYWPK